MFERQYKKFMAFLNKEEYDNVKGPIDPLAYHSMFFNFATLFSVMDNEKMSWWMYIAPVASSTSAITGGIICFISFVHYMQIFQIALITESGTYLVMMMFQLLVTTSIVRGKKQYNNLVSAIKHDFNYICTRGAKYREKFLANQRVTFQGYVFMLIVTASTGIGMTLGACAAVAVMLHGAEEGAIRPLPFPFWFFKYDLHATPVYEIIFVVSIWFTFTYTCFYGFMVQSHVVWVRAITCKADIISWNLQDLLVDVLPAKTKGEEQYYALVIKHRMREIVEMHLDMFELIEDYAAVYKKCLLFEQTIVPPVICMTAYCFTEKYKVGDLQILLLMLCIGTLVEEFLPNFLGTHLLEKVQSISDSCWNTPFWNAGPVIKPYLLLIMQRSMRPLPIAAPGFAEISLQTYATIITRAYQCFNMLRQANIDFS